MQIHTSRVATCLISFSISISIALYGLQPAYVFAVDEVTDNGTATVTQSIDTTAIVPDTTAPPDPTPDPAVINQAETPTDAIVDPITVTDPATAPVTIDQPALDTTVVGPLSPNGDASTTYIYNSDTGMWENNHYIWDPVTKQTMPKDQVNYSYNPATGRWDTTEWIYDAPSGKYVANVQSVALPAANVANELLADLPGTASASLSSNFLSPSYESTTLSGTNNPLNSSLRSPSNGHIFDLFYNNTISNTIESNSTSGDASVAGNTLGGNATSGTAKSVVNILNLMNSYWGLASLNPLVFMANIVGDVFGDLFINPQNITQQSTTANNCSSCDNSAIEVNSVGNGLISNDIDLNANSGDATVALNTTGGNATSGDAIVMANVINLMNSSIGAGQSFMGMLNIYGNLNGDVLLPSGMISSLLADNAGTSVQQNSAAATNLSATFDNNQTINNLISATADTGSADVTKNTQAGNAKSGDADTNVTILNLTGRQVVGKDALLVFVNVLGNWVGMIMNAPGSTAGLIGGSVNQDETFVIPANSVDINSVSNNTINNDISVNATSGDALVSKNTKAGNATSGDATATINLANINGSNFSLSDWFGILFINVYGNWYGSFGVNTAAGNPVTTPKANNPTAKKVFAFVPKTSTTISNSSSPTATYSTNGTTTQDSNNKVTAVMGITKPPRSNNPVPKSTDYGFVTWFVFITSVLVALGWAARYWYSRRYGAAAVTA